MIRTRPELCEQFSELVEFKEADNFFELTWTDGIRILASVGKMFYARHRRLS
jgi:hypothetical protein